MIVKALVRGPYEKNGRKQYLVIAMMQGEMTLHSERIYEADVPDGEPLNLVLDEFVSRGPKVPTIGQSHSALIADFGKL